MKRILLFTMLVISMSLMLSACGVRRVTVTADPNGASFAYHYWYYPHDEFYFDRDRNIYFYHEPDGWHKSAILPSKYSMDSHHVDLDENVDEPYVNHERHMRDYPRD